MVFQHCWRKFCFIFFNLIFRSLSIPKSSYFGSEFWPVSQLIALFVISNLNRTRQRNNAHKIGENHFLAEILYKFLDTGNPRTNNLNKTSAKIQIKYRWETDISYVNSSWLWHCEENSTWTSHTALTLFLCFSHFLPFRFWPW